MPKPPKERLTKKAIECAKSHAKHRDKRLIKLRAYYLKNRAKLLAQQAEYVEKNKEKVREYHAQWYLDNIDKQSATSREYYEEHDEEIKQRSSTWRKENPGKHSENNRRHRARKKGSPVNDLTHPQWLEIQAAQDYRCAHCEKRCKNHMTQDHIQPLSKGGSHTLHNVIAVCRNCNSKKHANESPVPVQPLLLTVAQPKKRKA